LGTVGLADKEGEMSVKQFPDGKWYYRFEYAKRGYLKSGFKNRRAAEQAEAVRKVEAEKMEAYGPSYGDRLKLNVLADMFYKEYVLPYKRSWKGDRAMIPIIKDFFGNKCIRDITPRDVEAFRLAVPNLVVGKSQPRASSSSVNRYHAELKAIINWGKKKRLYAGDNPAWGIAMLKVEKARVRFLSSDEEKRLTPVVAKDSRLWPFYVLGLHTGMRVSEICAIRVRDVIRHPTPMVFVAHSKTKRSRHVPLSDTAARVLVERSQGKGPEVRVLDQVNRETVSGWFKDACNEAQVEDFTFHCLRHTFTSHMLSHGVPIYKVSKMLGHSTVLTTEAHYGHMDRNVLSDEIHHIDSIISTPGLDGLLTENGAQAVKEAVNGRTEDAQSNHDSSLNQDLNCKMV
jgi:integrase